MSRAPSATLAHRTDELGMLEQLLKRQRGGELLLLC
jgi:hypothetical protein